MTLWERGPVSLLAFIWPTLAVLNRQILSAVRLSVLPVLAAVGVWMAGRLYLLPDLPPTVTGVVGYVAIELLGLSFCFAWFAIRWHRLLLLGEAQTALGGVFPPRALRRYALRLFGLLAALMLGGLLLSLVVDAIVPRDSGGLLRRVGFSLLGTYLFFRFSPALVGVPLGAPLTRGQSWRTTGRSPLPCLGLALGSLLITTFLQLPLTPADTAMTPFEPLYIVVTFWVQVLVFATAVSVVHRQTVMRPSQSEPRP